LEQKFTGLSTQINILSVNDVLNSSFDSMKLIASSEGKQADLMYLHYVLCHEGPNDNALYFFRNELESAYATVINKPYNWEHGLPIIGTVTDAVLVKPDKDAIDPRWSIECAAVVWKRKFPQYAKILYQDAPTNKRRNSMECFSTDYVYVLGNEEAVYTRDEMPELEDYIGKEYDGLPVYIAPVGVVFAGTGCVTNPADVDAIFLNVAEKTQEGDLSEDNERKENKVMADLDDKIHDDQSTDQQADDSVAVEDTTVADNPDVVEPDAVEPDEDTVVELADEGADEGVDGDTVEASVDASADDDAKDVEQQKEHIAGMLTDLLDERQKLSRFWELFYALHDAVFAVVCNGSKAREEKVSEVSDLTMEFLKEIHDLLPSILDVYPEVDMTEKVATLEAKLQAVTEEFNEYKSSVEAERKEIENQKRLASRLDDLQSDGIDFSDETKGLLASKLIAQSDDEFAQFKAMLLEVKSSTKQDKVKPIKQKDMNASLNVEDKGLKLETPLDRANKLVKTIFTE
jgi:hypothetical protein